MTPNPTDRVMGLSFLPSLEGMPLVRIMSSAMLSVLTQEIKLVVIIILLALYSYSAVNAFITSTPKEPYMLHMYKPY